MGKAIKVSLINTGNWQMTQGKQKQSIIAIASNRAAILSQKKDISLAMRAKANG
jgi:hypothetical protein